MNVFVLCTGRCGSTTLIEACKHISNFTSDHESRTGLLGSERLNYPENHIEADNRLTWVLGRLEKAYGDNAIYVHMKRDVKTTAASFVHRYDNGGIMSAYRSGGILMDLPLHADPMQVAMDYCDTVNSNVEAFLRNKTRKMEFRLENAKADFVLFCELIGAEVDMPAALAEFDKAHNASSKRRPVSYRRKIKAMVSSLSSLRMPGRLFGYVCLAQALVANAVDVPCV